LMIRNLSFLCEGLLPTETQISVDYWEGSEKIFRNSRIMRTNGLICAFGFEYHFYGFEDYDNIEPQGPVHDIPGIEFYSVSVAGVASAGDLP
jgi:hypothetical protein